MKNNTFNYIIYLLILKIEDFEDKLDMLTNISIATNDRDILIACEDIRDELVNESKGKD